MSLLMPVPAFHLAVYLWTFRRKFDQKETNKTQQVVLLVTTLINTFFCMWRPEWESNKSDVRYFSKICVFYNKALHLVMPVPSFCIERHVYLFFWSINYCRSRLKTNFSAQFPLRLPWYLVLIWAHWAITIMKVNQMLCLYCGDAGQTQNH